jgi:serine phosphatase RsbU (regulator of sigma subunit)
LETRISQLLRTSRRLSLRARAVIVTLTASLLQVAALYFLGSVADHHEVLGITGAVAVLIAVAAAALAGPVVGGVTSVVGGAAFFVFVTDLGATAPAVATLGSAAAWFASAVAAGMIADRLHRTQELRRRAEEEAAGLHERLEARLMPRIDVRAAGLEVHARSRPGERRLGIGGDFYDVAEDSCGGTAVVIGDVMGHGADAAALGATLRAAWRALVADAAPPARLVRALNEVLEHERGDQDAYATLCLAWLDCDLTGLRLAALGHPAPLLWAGGSLEPLQAAGSLPLGTFERSEVTLTRATLPSSWTLFFHTDGIVEGRAAPDSGERFGVHRLAERLAGGMTHASLAGALDRVLADVEEANGGALGDDATLLALSTSSSRLHLGEVRSALISVQCRPTMETDAHEKRVF